jgi:hypothetical protein
VNDGGPKYAVFLEQELRAEQERRTYLDGRAQTVVTTSGSVVALLAAVGSFLGSEAKRRVAGGVGYALVVTVTAFTFAVVFAIVAMFLFRYGVTSRASLQRLPREAWSDDEDVAVRNTMAMNVETICTLRDGNDQKARLVMAAWCSQLAAVASLGAAVYLIVIHG